MKFYFKKIIMVHNLRKNVVLSLKIEPSFEKIWLAQKFSQPEKLTPEKKNTSWEEAETDLRLNRM